MSLERVVEAALLVGSILCLTASIDLYYGLGLALLALYVKEVK